MSAKKSTIRIFSWNVNGLRAIHKKGFMDWFKKEKADIICLQETKIQEDQIPDEFRNVNGYKSFWFCAQKKGYSSVSIFTKIDPIQVTNGFDNEEFDIEGRVIISEYEKFVLANVYFPNGGRGPHRVKYKLDFYNELFFYLQKYFRERKGVIVCGDFNTAHKEIDLAEPDKYRTTSGFLTEERDWIDKIINLGYVDIFRKFNNEPNWYTYWDNIQRKRESNLGWRIDYFFVSEELVKNVSNTKIFMDVMGSDHCPLELELQI